MYKLCKWIYDLAYQRGWDDAKQNERDKAQQAAQFKKLAEKRFKDSSV